MNGKDILQKHGLKITKQRVAITDIIYNSDVRLTASDIYCLLKDSGNDFGIATVYRTLSQLVCAGAVTKCEMPDDESVYYSAVKPGHHHCLVCTKCRREINIDICPIDEVSEKIAKSNGFCVTGHSFEVFGICRECGKKQA